MRNRVPVLAAVLSFALAVAVVASLAGGDGGRSLEKLPVGSAGAADAAAAPAAAMAERSGLMAPYGGGVEYRVDGELPALPAEAPAYRLGTGASAERVARLAAALGLVGEVVEESGAWIVRNGGRELRVERIAGLPWSLGSSCVETPVRSDPTAPDRAVACASVAASTGSGGGAGPISEPCRSDGDGCVVATTTPLVRAPAGIVPPAPAPAPEPVGAAPPAAAPAPAVAPAAAAPPPVTVVAVPACKPGAECAGGTAPRIPPEMPAPPGDLPVYPVAPVEKPARPADFPSQEEAARLAREAFTRMGVALDGFAVDDGWLTWEARVEPHLGGLRVVGLGSGLGIGAGGRIEHGYGFLAVPELIGDYPLAGLEAGLRRLQEGFGPSLRSVPVDAGGLPPGAEPAVDLPAIAPVPCDDPAVSCAPPTTFAPVVLTVTGAHLVLLYLDAALVPAYVFELADGGETFPVPAVSDEWLDQAVPPAKG